MICYKDKTFCSSKVVKHTCGREFMLEDFSKSSESGLPIAWGSFCKDKQT